MQYRRFGKTEIEMPVITCGGMRFQHKWDDIPMEDVPADGQSNVERVIERALEIGAYHIETARGYGSSEMQLGKILPRFDRSSMVIQTKEAPTENPKEFKESFERSMGYLNLDYVDLLGIHGINNAERLNWTLRPGGCLEVAKQWKKEGRVRHIGFSTHASTDVILKAVESGEFDYVNVHWYFVNDLNWPVIKAATERDMGVFIISPNDKGGKLYEPPEKLRSLCEPLDPMVFNDLYCWNRPEVHTLSMGVSCPENFDTHLEALKHIDDAASVIAPVEKRLRDELDRVNGADWMAGWSENLPEWETLPHGINVKEIARLWTFAKGLDMIEFAKMRYNLLGNADHWFPGYKVAKFDDKEMIDALADYKFADRIPEMLREAHQLLDDEEVKRLSESD